MFLSYRHADDTQSRVRPLAEQLEAAGLTVIFDQFAQEREFDCGGPDHGWPHWSKSQARSDTHKILVVAGAGWFRCYERTETPGTGLGAAAEAAIIEQRLYNAAGALRNIRIVAFEDLDPTSLPLDLQSYHRFVVPKQAKDLVGWLKGSARPSHVQADWPTTLPALPWQMANHTAARDAFAQLIKRNPPHWYLPIQGVTETGKTISVGRCWPTRCASRGWRADDWTSRAPRMSRRSCSDSSIISRCDLPPKSGSLGQRLGAVLAKAGHAGAPGAAYLRHLRGCGELQSLGSKRISSWL